ncbi:MAG: GAF domain-containing protein [Anaerolineales bacterium]|nr:GAF domain-containing protein [Anaerolineales bacterium]
MNTRDLPRWRPSFLQMFGIAILLLIAFGFTFLMFREYSLWRNSTEFFNDQAEILITLSNIQRHTNLLFAYTMSWLSDPTTGQEQIERQRAFLSSQMRVLLPLLPPGSEVLEKMSAFQAELEAYDDYMLSLGVSPSLSKRLQARHDLQEQFRRMDEELVKRAYDIQERNFVLEFSALLQQQTTSRLLLLASGIVFILVISTSGFLYLRIERNTFLLRKSQLRELETALANRTRALQLAAEVSQHISALRDQASIVHEVVEQLKNAFNYYHAHIYLWDPNQENLVMVGGTGEVGKTLLERGHRIPRGKGLVGRATTTGQAVLVPDTSLDPDWLPNPLLPETRAEIAVPIVVGERVLGVLDVQNDQVGSLNELDVLLISTVADQVGIALENIRATEEVQNLLNDYQQLIEYSPVAIAILDAENGVFVQANPPMLELFELGPEAIGTIGPIALSPEYQPDGRPSAEAARERIQQALQEGTAQFEWIHCSAGGREFRAEIRLTPAPSRAGRPMLSAVITDITARYEAEQETRRRAELQAALNRIGQAIVNTTTTEAAIQVAARELGRELGKKRVYIQLQSPNVSSVGEIGRS